MRANVIIAGGLLLFGALVIASFRHVPNEGKEKSMIEYGIVTDMYEAGVKDLVLKLNGRARAYYLDQGLAQGMDLRELKNKLLHKQVTVKYNNASAFSTEITTRYISQLRFDEGVIYSDNE
jgi:hypothetical protein